MRRNLASRVMIYTYCCQATAAVALWIGFCGLGFLPLVTSFTVLSSHHGTCLPRSYSCRRRRIQYDDDDDDEGTYTKRTTTISLFPVGIKSALRLTTKTTQEEDTVVPEDVAAAAVVPPTVDNGGFFWDFRGHSCYSEIARPKKLEKDEQQKKKKKKPTLLLIHGFACSTVYWRETRTLLVKEGYTVHSIDLLGFGKSSKPGRRDGISYSIDLWAQMVDDYARRYMNLEDDNDDDSGGVVLVGNSLGSTVALSAFTGDCYSNSDDDSDDDNNTNTKSNSSYLSSNSRVKGLCFFNCGVGLNTRNALKAVDSVLLKLILNAFFDFLNLLIFNNKLLLSYLIDNQVSKETLREALLGLYKNATTNPSDRVDDELVNSFLDPVRKDSTEDVVEVLSQIYTNDAGRTPMEMHERHLTQNDKEAIVPIHLIWGTEDPIAPVKGDVGTFYSGLSRNPKSGITLELIEGAGHVPFDEKPECNEGLIRWLAKTI